MPDLYLCIHGHFYQPPRQNPLTGAIDREPSAAPYHDFNEKIWDECYRANAAAGNFACLSFDLGPTLAAWLQTAHPATLDTIIAAARQSRRETGHSNALAQSYHHTILPLATARERRLEIAWGLRDFRLRYGYAPEGLWLPETAADEATLEELAAQGVGFTILAPWQAADGVDVTEPYRVTLQSGRSLSAFFYHGGLSGDVSFNDEATADAGRFCRQDLAAQINQSKLSAGLPQLLLVATDGELYGHHKRFRDLFLKQLCAVEAPAAGFTVTSPAGYLAAHPPRREMAIRPHTSWSCAHGVARWDEGCSCTAGDASWKRPLRQSLRALATRLDDVFEADSRDALRDPWSALEHYLDLRLGAVSPSEFWRSHAAVSLRAFDAQRLHGLLEMQFARHAMFVSCAWFFDDLDRIEPRIALRQARYAVELARTHSGADLAPAFLSDLTQSLSLRSGRSAAEMYGELSAISDQPSANTDG